MMLRLDGVLPEGLKGREIPCLLFLTLSALLLRFYLVGSYPPPVFDEIGYIPAGSEMIGRNIIPSSHPPLGMFLIALGGKLWGATAFGWRFFSVLAGTACIPLCYFMARRLWKNPGIALTAAILMASDPMLFTMSRLALLDVFLCFFMLLSAFFFSGRQYALCALSIGCALSVKWNAMALIPFVLFIILLELLRKGINTKDALTALALLLLLPPLTYLAIWCSLHQTLDLSTVLQDHRLAVAKLGPVPAGGYLSSPWWSWLAIPQFIPLADKRVIFEGKEITVIMKIIENPAFCWAGIAAFFITLAEALKSWRKGTALDTPLLFFAAAYFPWMFIHRATFLFYLLPALPFLCLILAYALNSHLKPGYQALSGAGLLLFNGLAFFTLYPHLVGWLP